MSFFLASYGRKETFIMPASVWYDMKL